MGRHADAPHRHGEERFAHRGGSIVKVIPVDAPDRPAPQRIGFIAGPISVPDDFDSMGSGDIVDSLQRAQIATPP